MNEQQSGNSSGAALESGRTELGNQAVGDAENETSNVQENQYEGVTAAQFDEAMQLVNEKVDVLNVSCLLLVAALFACFGAICVQTLLKSFTWER